MADPLERPPLAYTVRDVTFRYGRRVALTCPHLDVPARSFVAFTGPNGSGKTTLLKVLNGLIGPVAGTIHFFGRPLSDAAHLRRRSVFLHQQPVLFAGTVADNLAFALRIHRVPAAAAAERVAAASTALGIGALLDRPAQGLSGGEVQRVALARALVLGVDVLLLDEPTAAMDQANQVAVRAALAALHAAGKTLIVSTHDETLVADRADLRVRFSGDGVATAEVVADHAALTTTHDRGAL